MIDNNNLNFSLSEITRNSKNSQLQIQNKTNNFVNKLINEIANTILDKKMNEYLSSSAVNETGFGNVADKINKNYNKINNLILDLKKVNLLKPELVKKEKIYKIFKPIGIICGVTPSTNPIATTVNYILNSIKARNSIIICPNPRTYETVNKLINIIKDILKKKKISSHLVQIAPKDILRDDSIIELFNLCDKNIVTGNETMISRVKKSIKPFLVFGKGNVPVVIDETADFKQASKYIVASKSFDNSTSCSADSVLIVREKIYKSFLKFLKKEKVYILDKNEKNKLDQIYFYKGNINPRIIAKNANVILKKLDIKLDNDDKYKIIGYEIDSFEKSHFIFDEKLLPIVGIISSKNLDNSIEIAQKILEINGKGHSAGIYSNKKSNIMKFSINMPVSRIIVNQPHSLSAGGSKNNFLKSTLSLGCGAWGGNLSNENLNINDFCNLSKVVYNKKYNINE